MIRSPIRKLLVANRGEIALRILRTCRDLGIATVAVYSEADRLACHVRLADEAVAIGPAPAEASYLSIERIVEAARTSGADALHPGYGFLSENPALARASEEAGIRFVGPPSAAIEAMADKTRARALMQEAGVPVVPGSAGAVDHPDEVRHLVEEIGYPVLVKAAMGGGGKGMRIVRRSDELDRALEMARGEAHSAFSDGRLFVEKYIADPRHIEVQVLGDAHGSFVHLFERECSIQRRHQKVIEEAPSTLLTPEQREAMGEAAIRAARACGYVNAGTIEFLVDGSGAFYFMEMNTRLQVEHPVTEWITGLDLVREQLRIASGEPLGYTQEAIAMSGHAIECRVYAEDPENGFLPDPGKIVHYLPPSGPGIRVDGGVESGDEVSMHYDPLVAKVTAWGLTREVAIQRMQRALAEYELAGVRTTIPFCRFVLAHDAFRRGDLTTHFVADHFTPDELPRLTTDELTAAALAAALAHARKSQKSPAPRESLPSRWLTRRLT